MNERRIMLNALQIDIIGPTKCVWLVLVARANDAGLCWPSMELLARDAGVSARTARSAVRELEERGLVRSEVRPRLGSRYTIVDFAGLNERQPGRDRTWNGVPGSAPANAARRAGLTTPIRASGT